MTEREKQIEEMARVIEYCAHKDCDSCKQQGNFRCSAYNHAVDLYNAGYRKTDEVTLRLDLGDRSADEIKWIAELLNGEIKKQVAREILGDLVEWAIKRDITIDDISAMAKTYGIEADND